VGHRYRDDDEAFHIWHQQVGVAAERIVAWEKRTIFGPWAIRARVGLCYGNSPDQGRRLAQVLRTSWVAR